MVLVQVKHLTQHPADPLLDFPAAKLF